MRKTFLLMLCCFTWLVLNSQVKVSFEDLIREPDKYVGQRVKVTTPLVITGVYYDSLIVSDQRLFVPEEQAVGLSEGDSTEYYRLLVFNRSHRLRIESSIKPYSILTGGILKGFEGLVTQSGVLVTGKAPHVANNKPADRLPKVKEANLVICSSNVQNLFADLGGYAGAKTEKQLDMQLEKTAKGLLHSKADLFALCEVEKGNKTAALLCERMNRLSKSDSYRFVPSRSADGDTIGVCFIYRLDKIAPYGETSYAYPIESIYGERFKMQGFTHIPSGEQFVVSLNHLRSKRGPAQRADSLRMLNIQAIEPLLDAAPVTYRDSDILILGDFNCYTYERPIQYLVQRGYADLLPKGDYSYVYKGESGSLDRVFASPSMAGQIISVKALHLNADYFYSLGYRSRYAKPTRYRYSDHDPVIIYVRLKNADDR